MELLGHPTGPPRPPLGRLSEKDLADLRTVIDQLGIPTAADRVG
jgi:hypothetical protein